MTTLTVAYGSDLLPLRIGIVELPCFILENKQSIFTIHGLQKALGYDGKSEDWLFDFLSSINKFYPVSGDLFDAYENPILFELKRANSTVSEEKGILPQTLILTCETIQNAKKDGYLHVSQLKYAKAALVLVNYFYNHDAEQAIAEASGLNFAKETGKMFLQNYFLKNGGSGVYYWTSALRDAFWEKLFEIKGWHWGDLRENPKAVALVLHEVVFSRLTDHLTEVLHSNKPKRSYRTKNPAPDNEHPELRLFISEILSLLKAAAGNWTIFLQLMNRVYPKNGQDLNIPNHQLATPVSSTLDLNLKKAVAVNKLHKNK